MPGETFTSFPNRTEAGRQLAQRIAAHLRKTGRSEPPLVLGLPRGGVPVAEEVARAIKGDLDIMVARKIGLPWQPELGVGAVTEDGPPVFDHSMLTYVGLTEEDLSDVVSRERAEVRRRLNRYRPGRPPVDVTNRVVVLVDDGLATGVTARAALRALDTKQPAYLLFAAPVCARDSAAAIKKEADAVVCARQPAQFHAVGLWYEDFTQLTDEDVIAILERVWARPN
jgi:predicted phosphoribosyltransferase